jgi:chromosomal replication initiator protein
LRAGNAQEVTTSDTDIVSALRCALAERVGDQRFGLWFGPNTWFKLDEHKLVVGAPNRFLSDWISSNFRSAIEAACQSVMGRCPELQFVIDGSQSNSKTGAAESTSSRTLALESSRVVSPQGPRFTSPATASSARGPGDVPSTQSRRRHVLRFKTFVTGPCNRTARAAAEMILDEPGVFSPLLIHGPTSVGKTHLLQAILAEARHRRLSQSAVYLTAEQFTTYFLEALRGSGLPSFRQKYRGVKLLLIDDLQFFRGKRSTLVELLYTVDTLQRRDHQLVFAADRPLSEMTDLGAELIARLAAGNECPIRRPDYATRLGIVEQMTRRFEMSVPREVQEFIAARLTGHARELSGALCRLRATSEAMRRPIRLAMAEESLAEMIRHSYRVVRLPDIQKAVCDVLGIGPESLQASRRAKRVSHPRMLAMWLARKHTRAALSEIGHFFGRRSHSTVVSAQKRVDAWLAKGEQLELADRTLGIDEAIQRVEQALLAG